MEIKPRIFIDKVPVWCAHDKIVNCVELKPNPKNPNTHPEKQIDLLGKIILAQGWRAPITVSNRSGLIVKGHGRLEAAFKAGILKAPVDFQDYESEAAEHADLVADNRLAELAEIDDDKLTSLLSELNDFDIDMDLTGFLDVDLKELLEGQKGLTDDDAVPEVPEEPVTQAGDLYILGNHRLLCGDATKKEDVERLMDGQKADMVFTDPPYGVFVNQGTIEDLKARNRRTDGLTVQNDDLQGENLRDFLLVIFSLYNLFLKDGGSIYVCHAESLGMDVIFRTAFAESGFKAAEIIIWVKDQFVFGRQDYHWRHEPIIYGWKKGAAHYFIDDHTQDTVWEIVRPKRSEYHPTMKPIELCEKAIKNSSKAGHLISDLFLGSGSTLIACEKTKRQCYGMEIDPHYCDVIIKRWEDYTGKKAKIT